MTTTFKIRLIASVFAFSALFFGCKSNEEQPEEEIKDKISVETEVKQDIVLSDIPSPEELTSDIAKSGALIKKEILNSTSKAANYNTNAKKALNLGIYFADLGYVAGYNQAQDAANYLNAIKQIADGLGVSKAFDQSFYERFSKNMGNNDSISIVMDDGYKSAKNYLVSNDRIALSCQVQAGGWVEGLYIATQILGNSPKDANNAIVFQRIGEQKYSLKNLFDLFNQIKTNPEVMSIMEMMQDIQSAYNDISPANVGPAQVALISEKVTALRNKIIN